MGMSVDGARIILIRCHDFLPAFLNPDEPLPIFAHPTGGGLLKEDHPVQYEESSLQTLNRAERLTGPRRLQSVASDE